MIYNILRNQSSKHHRNVQENMKQSFKCYVL